MQHTGKFIIAAGIVLLAVGTILWTLGKLGFRSLPGDIQYASDRLTVFFPLGTCLLVSVALTAAFWLWRWLHRP